MQLDCIDLCNYDGAVQRDSWPGKAETDTLPPGFKRSSLSVLAASRVENLQDDNSRSRKQSGGC